MGEFSAGTGGPGWWRPALAAAHPSDDPAQQGSPQSLDASMDTMIASVLLGLRSDGHSPLLALPLDAIQHLIIPGFRASNFDSRTLEEVQSFYSRSERPVLADPHNLIGAYLTSQIKLPVQYAALDGDWRAVRSLCSWEQQRGIRVKVQGLTSEAGQLLNGKCGTVQTYAADKGRWEVIIENVKGRKALKHANLLFDREEITLISCLTAICAAQNGHEACLLVLRDAGCNLNQATNAGATPAFIAAAQGHEACLSVLRDAGCDLSQATNGGTTPAIMACQNGHDSCLALLRDAGCDLNQAMNVGVTPAFIAAGEGHESCLVLLRDAGCDLGKAGRDGATPACIASQKGHEACLAVLRDAGCDLGQATNDGGTPACIAAGKGHDSCLVLLRDAGCDLGQATSSGLTPAWMASQNGHDSCLVLLRDAGCDLGKADNEGATPACVAAGDGRKSCLVLLRDAGCDLGKATNNGATPG